MLYRPFKRKRDISSSSRQSSSYYVSFGGFSQQPSERDDGRHAGAVEEEDGRQTLQADRVPDVTPQEGRLPPDVVHQTTEDPDGQTESSHGHISLISDV